MVPSALALKNESLFGPTPLRVVPDISMDADAQTGMLIGLTQVFPNGTYYAQFKEGGTSLASPLLAGVVADADQAAHVSLDSSTRCCTRRTPSTRPPSRTSSRRPARTPPQWSGSTTQTPWTPPTGYIVSLRVIPTRVVETYCDGTGNCASRDVTLSTGPGYDSMTGLGSVGPTFISSLSKF